MILNLTDADINDKLIIELNELDYLEFKRGIDYDTDEDVCKILDEIIKNIDCRIEYDIGRPMMTTNYGYHKRLSEYYRYLLKLQNQFLYNKYFDKLIDTHRKNIIFEHDYPCTPIVSNKKAKRKKVKSEFVRTITKDLFTGEKIYQYTNIKTKKEINSNNPNLLNKLNNKSKYNNKAKSNVSIDSMTFSFKTK